MLPLTLAALVLLPQESRSHFDTPQIVLDPVYIPAWGDAGRFTNVGDFDGDGHLDLVGEWGHQNSYSSYQELKFWYGDGTGALVRRVLSEVLVAQGNVPVLDDGFTAVGEIGVPDGRDDVVHAYNESFPDSDTAVLRLFLGRPTSPFFYRVYRVPGRLLDVEIADFDGNGTGDVAALLVDSTGQHTLRFLLDSPVPVRTLGLPAGDWEQLERGEFSGDGVTDLTVVSPRAMTFRSLEHGHKALHAPGPDTIAHVLVEPDSAAGDLDGDGDDDVVLFTHQGYQVVWQVRPGEFEISPHLDGGPATELADIDGDGDLDGVCCGGGGGSGDVTYDPRADSHFEISLNDGTGVFAPSFSLPGLASEHIAGAVDFDEDGEVDLIAGRVIYFSPGGLAPRIAHPTPDANLQPGSIGDVDGDGDPDFGLGLGICRLNRGDGRSLDAPPSMPAPPAGTSFVGPGFPGDLDGDGCTDLLVEAWQGTSFVGLHLLRNSGGGSFADAGLVATPPQPYSVITSLDARSCRVTDLDGDGDADLLVHGHTGLPSWSQHFVALWSNPGSGPLGAGPTWPGENLIDVADLDGDLLVDLVVTAGTGTASGRLYWRPGLGGGAFGGRLLIKDNQYGFNFEIEDELCTFPDVSTGLATVAGIRQGSGVYRYPRSGSSWLELDLPAVLRTEYWATDDLPSKSWFRSCDVNGDGFGDLLSWPAVGKGSGLVLNGPAGLDASGPRLLMEPRTFADVDGDGDEDAITAEGVVLNRTREGELAGARIQYGSGGAGTGGIVPTLGAVGPFRTGSTVEFRITGGLGGAQATFGISRTKAEIADWPVQGLTAWIDPADSYFQTVQVTLDGPAGLAGAGSATIPFTVPAGFTGVREYYQVWVQDPAAPNGVAASNGLELGFGSP